MLDYKKEYQRWLTSDALSAEEKAELKPSPATKRRSNPGSTARWSSAQPACGAR